MTKLNYPYNLEPARKIWGCDSCTDGYVKEISPFNKNKFQEKTYLTKKSILEPEEFEAVNIYQMQEVKRDKELKKITRLKKEFVKEKQQWARANNYDMQIWGEDEPWRYNY